MDPDQQFSPLREIILDKLSSTAAVKQNVHDKTAHTFGMLKELLHEMSSEISDELEERGRRIRIEYRDRGKFEAQLQLAGDMLLFTMHTDIFEFNRDHPIWRNPYVISDKENSFCGVINIYNFLADSFKYNRNEDEGYLIGRLFINREACYFVEGKRQTSLRHDSFGKATINKEALTAVVESAIDYSLDFDLLLPPYDAVKTVTVDQFNTKLENSKVRTGKRLGYEFNSDDI